MNLDWSLARPVDVAGRISEGFERGVTGGAVNALMRDPNNRNAMSALAFANPDAALAMQDRQRRQAAQDAQLREQQIENEGRMLMAAASFLEGVNDPQTYAAARQQFMQMFPDARNVPEQYDPNMLAQIRQRADRWQAYQQRGRAPQQSPSSVQEFEYARAQGFQGSYMDFLESKRGPIVAANPDQPGTFTIIPRSMIQPGGAPQQGEITATNPQTGERVRLNPQTNQWEPIQGGASPSNGSPTFPGAGTEPGVW